MGELVVGDQLPLIREVVAALVINPNTVQKAYRALEAKGLLEGRPGQGTYVRATPGAVPFGVHAGLRRTLNTWIRSARAAGLDDTSISALFATTLHDQREGTVA